MTEPQTHDPGANESLNVPASTEAGEKAEVDKVALSTFVDGLLEDGTFSYPEINPETGNENRRRDKGAGIGPLLGSEKMPDGEVVTYFFSPGIERNGEQVLRREYDWSPDAPVHVKTTTYNGGQGYDVTEGEVEDADLGELRDKIQGIFGTTEHEGGRGEFITPPASPSRLRTLARNAIAYLRGR